MNPGKGLVVTGLVLVLMGILYNVLGKWSGRFPGDILIQKDHFTFYFPVGLCLFISGLLTLFFWFFGRH